jgi:hypothetical protein
MKSFTRWLAATVSVLALATVFSAAPAHAQAADADKKVTVNLKDIPLRAAIDALFAGTGLQYSVNPDVQNVPVNLNIRDVGLQAALRLLVRQAATAQPGLTFSKDGDIFVVKVRRDNPNPMPTVEEAPPEYTDEASEFTWEKIPIQFNNAAVFVLAFGGTMLPTEADVLMGGMGGGMGGMGGGMMGGMGGMGMGGGMMGGMGGMGGGMMGGMGGFGGMCGIGGGMRGGLGGMGLGGMMGGLGGMGGGMMGGMGGMGGGMMGGMGGFGGGFGGRSF